MRFKIDFKLSGDPPFAIPVNYQSEISSWIHKMLHFEDSDFKDWLSTNKYLNHLGEYNLFTFSDVFFAPHKVQKDKMIVEDGNAGMIISFYAPEEIKPFIISIFENQEFKIGDSGAKVAFQITDIASLGLPAFGSMQEAVFSALSPILIAEPGKSAETFMIPDQKDFDKVFFKSLMFKYANLVKYMPSAQGNGLNNLNELKFKLLGKPKTKRVKIKTDTPHQKSVKGYLFDFEVKAPSELLRIGYNAGFGELNNLGFGCCDIKTK
jgi:CRISPR-associated endoribonuclease Cas6